MKLREQIFPAYIHSVEVPQGDNLNITTDRLEQAAKWLEENFTSDEWRYWGAGEFLFRDHRVAVAFKLRFGTAE